MSPLTCVMRAAMPDRNRLLFGTRSRISPTTSAPRVASACVSHEPRIPVQPVTKTRRPFQNSLLDKIASLRRSVTSSVSQVAAQSCRSALQGDTTSRDTMTI
jgi:hypothetical protein